MDTDDLLVRLQGKVLADESERILMAAAAGEDFERGVQAIQRAVDATPAELDRLECEIGRLSQ